MEEVSLPAVLGAVHTMPSAQLWLFVWLGYALTQPWVLTAPGRILEVSVNRLLSTSCVPGLGRKSQC